VNLDIAFDILHVDQNCSYEELLVAYRKLVKIYHPDRNAHQQEFAHKIMSRVNEAFEIAKDYLTSVSDDGDQGPVVPEEEEPVYEFADLFEAAFDGILEGVYIYYQYGLENIHLRQEGVRRFRYRVAVKRLKNGIKELEALQQFEPSADEAKKLKVFTDFSKAFLQNMLIQKYYIPSAPVMDAKAHRHYANGSMHLDSAIKRKFFRDLDANFGENAEGVLQVSYHEFMTVLVKYTQSTWIPETLIKMYLLENLEKIHKLRMAG
jgi:hypothetical protein